MVEFKIKINAKQRLAYIPKELVSVLGFEVKATANRVAVLLFPESADYKNVLRSVEIIADDLRHALALQAKEGVVD